MSNLLKNPNFQWVKDRDEKRSTHFFETATRNVIVVEQPEGWSYVYAAVNESDPSLLAKCLHDPSASHGMRIEGGWRKFQAGLQQRVVVQAGRRYRLAVTFRPEIYFNGGNYDPYSVRVYLTADGQQLTDAWLTIADHHHKTLTLVAEFQAAKDGEIPITCWYLNRYAITNNVITWLDAQLVDVAPEPPPNGGGDDDEQPTPPPDPAGAFARELGALILRWKQERAALLQREQEELAALLAKYQIQPA